MRSSKNVLAILGIGLLLFAACMVPTLAAALEDSWLQSRDRIYKVERISLDPGEADLTDRLSAVEKIQTQEYAVIHKSDGSPGPDAEHVRKTVEDYIAFLSGGSIQAKYTLLDVGQIMVTDTDTGGVYSMWQCIMNDREWSQSVFWLDAETEKVLAFEIPFDFEQGYSEKLRQMTEKMAEYYGFARAEWVDGDADKESFPKQDFASKEIRFLNSAGERQLSLLLYKCKDKLSFNLYSY